jgi:hypothetical protein
MRTEGGSADLSQVHSSLNLPEPGLSPRNQVGSDRIDRPAQLAASSLAVRVQSSFLFHLDRYLFFNHYCILLHFPGSEISTRQSADTQIIMSDFDLETAKAQSPMLHIIPYNTTYYLYRFPPGTPGLGSLLGNIFTAKPQSSSSSSKDTFDVRTADPERLKRAGKGWLTVTKTEEEVSIMVDSQYTAADAGSFDANAQLEELVQAQGSDGIKDGPFACLRIRGPMELSEWSRYSYRRSLLLTCRGLDPYLRSCRNRFPLARPIDKGKDKRTGHIFVVSVSRPHQ